MLKLFTFIYKKKMYHDQQPQPAMTHFGHSYNINDDIIDIPTLFVGKIFSGYSSVDKTLEKVPILKLFF